MWEKVKSGPMQSLWKLCTTQWMMRRRCRLCGVDVSTWGAANTGTTQLGWLSNQRNHVDASLVHSRLTVARGRAFQREPPALGVVWPSTAWDRDADERPATAVNSIPAIGAAVKACSGPETAGEEDGSIEVMIAWWRDVPREP